MKSPLPPQIRTVAAPLGLLLLAAVLLPEPADRANPSSGIAPSVESGTLPSPLRTSADSTAARLPAATGETALTALATRLGAEEMEFCRITLPPVLTDEMELVLTTATATRTLQLTRRSVRSKNFKILVQEPDGTLTEQPVPEVGTYSGILAEDPDTLAYVTVVPGGIRARFLASSGPVYAVDAVPAEAQAGLSGVPPSGSGLLHAVYREAALTQFPGRDSSRQPLEIAAAMRQAASAAPGVEVAEDGEPTGPGGDCCPNRAGTPDALPEIVANAPGATVTVKQAEMGFDVGRSFYTDWGASSIPTTTGYIEAWMNDTQNPVFINGPLVENLIGTVIIRTTAATDPWNGMGDAYTILPKIKEIWNGGNASFPRPSSTHDLATCVLDQGIGVTGLANVGVVGTSSKYSVATSSSGIGYWRSGLRHEVGHNFSLSHGDGCDTEPTNNWDDMGLMCGGYHDRANTVEASKMLSHRNSRATGVLVDIGLFPAATRIRPYCPKDVSYTASAGGSPVTLDVLANDYDANGDTFTISGIDIDKAAAQISQTTPVAVTTTQGGTVIRSVGTGPGGRDRLIYTPPATSPGGTDQFHYYVKDPGGLTNWGFVSISLGGSPPDPFGAVVRTGVLTDSLLDWTLTPDPGSPWQWQPGTFTSPAGDFLPLTNPAAAATWLGGAGAVLQNTSGPPRVGQYAMETSLTQPAVRRWTSDIAAEIAIDYTVHRIRSGGTGQSVSITRNRAALWTQALTNSTLHFSGTVRTRVIPGDTIDLVSTAGTDETDDFVQFQARIYPRYTTREDGSPPVFHYRMDEGSGMAFGAGGDYDRRHWAADSGGLNHPALLTNADNTSAWNGGIMGNAFDADGVDDYLETRDASLGDGATEMTLSAWIFPDTKKDNVSAVSSTGPDFCGLLLSGYGSGNPVEFRVKSNRLTAPDNTGKTGKWTHVTGVWKAGQFQKLYLDGVEAGSMAGPAGTLDVDKWLIGTDRLIANRYFDGRIDDVALWTRAFSAGEVQALFEQGSLARDYDGSTDVTFLADSHLGTDISELSLSVWFKADTLGSNRGIITSAGDYFGLLLSGVAGSGNAVQFRARSNSLDAPANSTPTGEWTHAAGVWKSGMQKLYLNGALVATSPSPPTGTATPTTWNIGRDREIAGRFFDGQISDVLIPGRALTEDEVLALYNAGRTGWDASHGILTDISAAGTLALPGRIAEAGGSYSLSASGTGPGGTTDSFQWSRINHSGPGEFTGRIDSVENTHPNAQAGLMLRESVNPDAAFVFLSVRADRQISLTQRIATGAAVTVVTAWSPAPPDATWLRLLRSGDTVAARISSDGESWSPFGLVRTPLTPGTLAGIATTSGTQSTLSTAVLGGISAGLLTDPDLDLDSLPDVWEVATFGSTAIADHQTDFDEDGQTDVMEYIAGTLPKDPASTFAAGIFTLPDGRLSLTWPAATGRRYTVRQSPRLVAGTWTDAATDLTAPPLILPAPPPGTPRLYFRVEARLE